MPLLQKKMFTPEEILRRFEEVRAKVNYASKEDSVEVVRKIRKQLLKEYPDLEFLNL